MREWFSVFRHFRQFFSHIVTVFACNRYYGCYHIALPHWSNRAENDPNKSHYSDTRPTSPISILLMLSAKRGSVCSNFHVFGLTRPWIDPTTSRLRDERPNHYATAAVRVLPVSLRRRKQKPAQQTGNVHNTIYSKKCCFFKVRFICIIKKVHFQHYFTKLERAAMLYFGCVLVLPCIGFLTYFRKKGVHLTLGSFQRAKISLGCNRCSNTLRNLTKCEQSLYRRITYLFIGSNALPCIL